MSASVGSFSKDQQNANPVAVDQGPIESGSTQVEASGGRWPDPPAHNLRDSLDPLDDKPVGYGCYISRSPIDETLVLFQLATIRPRADMDFSKYGAPSEEWLDFITSDPTGAQDGHQDNDTSKAEYLRATSTKKRESISKDLMGEKNLHSRVHIETIEIPSRDNHVIPVRRFAPRNSNSDEASVLLFFHGGGFLFGSETSDDVQCSTISSENNIIVLSVIYRHTPEAKHPAQHNDAWDAYVHLRDRPEDLRVSLVNGLFVIGISAGAGLAAGVILRDLVAQKATGDVSAIDGVILAIPWLVHIDNYPFEAFASHETTAKIQCSNAPVIPAARLRLFTDILDAHDVGDYLLNTALAPDVMLQGWPRTAFLVAGMDPLRDDGLLFATRLKELRTPTRVHIFSGVPHGFRRWSKLPICKIYDECLDSSLDWVKEGKNHGHELNVWQVHRKG